MITNGIILVENYGVDLENNYWIIKGMKVFSRKYTKRATRDCPVALFYALM